MLQNSTKHYPSALPPYYDLPEELRPKLSRICTLRAKMALLRITISQYEVHLRRLRTSKEALSREAIEIEVSLWEALGKVKKLPHGPGATKAFRCEKPLTESEPLTSDEKMLAAMNSLSADARAELIAKLVESQRADLAKTSATQGEGDWETSMEDLS